MKITPKRFLLLVIGLGFIALAGSGCQTTKGFGRDVEHVGDKIQGQ